MIHGGASFDHLDKLGRVSIGDATQQISKLYHVVSEKIFQDLHYFPFQPLFVAIATRVMAEIEYFEQFL